MSRSSPFPCIPRRRAASPRRRNSEFRNRSMLILPGAPALSAFRITKLLGSWRAREPAVSGLTSRFVHFVDTERDLEASEFAVLERLLTYGPRPGGGDADGAR